ncbi:MAG: PQQ-dependent sugar dehydrogenase [Candidatus Nanopelagicales bacterium]|nr:PQQ-dependent sugar dehydrogenase [Candidatus Nanopelagicales bacterium]
MRRRTSAAAVLAVAVVGGAIVSPMVAGQASANVLAAAPHVVVDRTVTSGLTSPWGLAFLPDGSALVSERDTGLVKRIPVAGGSSVVVGRVRGVVPQGEGGLLGIAVPPGPAPAFVFAYSTGARDNRVVRIAWDGSRLGRQTPILTGIPKNTYHDGGRLLVGPDSTLFVGTGDAGSPQLAQDRSSLAGKVLRITFDGRPAAGNPFPRSPVYTLGHRNVQGLAFDRAGRLWATEFGERDADELNLLQPGRNYGWPVHEGSADDSRYTNPAAQWSPTSTASPSGIAILGDVAYVASLRGQVLWQVPLDGAQARTPIALRLGDRGRLRTVAVAPDGSLWLITSNTDGRGSPRPNDDRILKLAVG